MQKKWVGLIALALVLSACQAKEETTRSSTEGLVSSSARAVSSKEASQTNSDETKVIDTGEYYAIQGKYEEIVLVNKQHPLASDYAPGENEVAKAAFLKLLDAMRSKGYAVSDSYSGYRSYETQTSLYNAYVEKDGKAAADRYSARPGYSEHQTGLAFDILDATGQLLTDPSAATWLQENAPDYGFIVRYLEGKEESTGYMAESWHIRYIGKEAKEIASSGLSLEEYFGVKGGDYPD